MSRLKRIIKTSALAIGMMSMALAIQAQTTIYVDDDAPSDPGPGDPAVSSAFEDGSTVYPFDAIQEGIDAAGHSDTVLVRDGVYSGAGNRDLTISGKLITVTSENGPYNTIIYLRREGRGFYLTSNLTEETRLDGFFIGWGLTDFAGGGISIADNSHPIIANCVIHGNETTARGGGINVSGSCNPTFLNCLITDNIAQHGGGMSCYSNSSPELTFTEISGNYASHYGGGIYLSMNMDFSQGHCTVSDNYAGLEGGGIYCLDNTDISHCTISGNHAGERGGGIRATWENEISHCIVSDNYASLEGGGIFCSSDQDISHCTVSGNHADDQGGGIYCWGWMDVSQCMISDNHAGASGGGIFIFAFQPSYFDQCTLTYNSAPAGGGFYGKGHLTDCAINYSIGPGVHIQGDSSITGSEICDSEGPGIYCDGNSTLIENCLIAGSAGPGIYCHEYTDPVVESCTITGNHSPGYGGGIHCSIAANPEINHCTVTQNSSARGGGGIYCYAYSHPTVTNAIFWDNDAPIGPEIYLREYPSGPSTLLISYSDVEGGESAAVVEADCWLFWMWGMHSDDPLFVDPDGPDDDVLTWEDNDYHLSEYSPCIEAGDPFTVPASDDIDMDGEPRLVDTWVDMGADEYIEDGAVFVCDIRCLTPLVHPGEELIFETAVQNVTNQNQTARFTYNIYLCTGEFFIEHKEINSVPFSPYLTRTDESTTTVPVSIPAFMKDCDLRYELVVSRRVSGKVLCTSSCYFQIQDAPRAHPQFE